jgi:hypothetical protein
LAVQWTANASERPGAACKVEFDAFLECGILAHGFLRLRCDECGHDKLLRQQSRHRPVLESLSVSSQLVLSHRPLVQRIGSTPDAKAPAPRLWICGVRRETGKE